MSIDEHIFEILSSLSLWRENKKRGNNLKKKKRSRAQNWISIILRERKTSIKNWGGGGQEEPRKNKTFKGIDWSLTNGSRNSSSSFTIQTVIVVVAVVSYLNSGKKTFCIFKEMVTSIRLENLHRNLPKIVTLKIIDRQKGVQRNLVKLLQNSIDKCVDFERSRKTRTLN